MTYPILYSLRNCPYAMRARMGLLLSQQSVWLRDIVMTNIPDEMLRASAKGTVPVLVFDNGKVIYHDNGPEGAGANKRIPRDIFEDVWNLSCFDHDLMVVSP